MTSVCLYVISSQSARRTACVLQQRVRNVPEAAGKHICVCVVTIVYVSNKLSNCGYLGFCVCGTNYYIFISKSVSVFLCCTNISLCFKEETEIGTQSIFMSEAH